MKWSDVESQGVNYSLAHLHPFVMPVPVGNRIIDVYVTFGFHVFTDEKGNGKPICVNEETRFFCKTRLADSHQAVHFMQTRFADSHTRPYFSKSGQQQFYVMDLHEYALFLAIQKPENTTNKLNCRVISAYTVDTWGKQGLPRKGTVRKMGFVLDKRERGETIKP